MPISEDIAREIGGLPYRLVLAGGWIDQPFVNRHNPEPPGSMLVVSLEPTFRWMDRSGLATSTRDVARRIWGEAIPARDPEALVRELYEAENAGAPYLSGSQDMAGMIYPGISRLDYGKNDVYPRVTSERSGGICNWLESVLWILPICARPAGYDPLLTQNLDPGLIAKLGANGRECWEAIQQRNVRHLAQAVMGYLVWATAILPCHLEHPALTLDLRRLWKAYVASYPGASYSGPGGGYLIVVSERPVPGAFQIKVRRE